MLDGHRLKNIVAWFKERFLPGAEIVLEQAFDKFIDTFKERAIQIVAGLENDLSKDGPGKMLAAIGTLGPEVTAAGWVAGTAALQTLLQGALIAVRTESGKEVVKAPE